VYSTRLQSGTAGVGMAVIMAGCSISTHHANVTTTSSRPVRTLPKTTRSTTTVVPPTTTTTIDPECEQSTPVDGCPLGTPAPIAWVQQQDQAAQATATQEAEQAYEQCLNNDAQATSAALQQGFNGQPLPAGTPTWEPCSTAGLTPAEVQQAQDSVGP
jgi:hypothetical protein